MANDPICGMAVDERNGVTASYEGRSYYFCCGGCKSTFEKDPEKYSKPVEEGARRPQASGCCCSTRAST